MEQAEDPEKYYIEVIMQKKIKLYPEYVEKHSFLGRYWADFQDVLDDCEGEVGKTDVVVNVCGTFSWRLVWIVKTVIGFLRFLRIFVCMGGV